ncbi:MAG: ISKra4 family transposase, partial [Gaiellaceae bacterium]
MRSSAALGSTHGELETYLIEKTRDIARDMMQGHLELRAAAERPVRVVGDDGVERLGRRASSRRLRLLVGEVVVDRLIYQAPGAAGLCPQDGALSLPLDSFSIGVRRRVAEEVSAGSFDHVVERIKTTTGAAIAKRQVEQLAQASIVDFEAFYAERAVEAEGIRQFLVLTFDGAGIIMRTEGLRDDTRREAERSANAPKMWPERTKTGEKPNRKRMAEVASVYGISPYIRTTEDVMGELSSVRIMRTERQSSRPRPVNKRTWASVECDMGDVIEEGFLEALRRDPDRRRRWVVVVDGQLQQLRAIKAAAADHGVDITIVCDFIHTMEYLWKAAYCFHAAGSNEARQWVAEHAKMLLDGSDPSQVAAGMRRSATLRKLGKRTAVDKCAAYIRKRRDMMRYRDALAQGFPIASGVIEGACRHL